MNITNCKIQDNRVFGMLDPCAGSGVYNGGTMVITNSSIQNNYARYGYGGGIYNYAGTVTMTNCKIQNNNAEYGGGIYSTGVVNCDEKTIIKNNEPNNIVGNAIKYPTSDNSTIFVSPNGNDENDGLSLENPKKTITSAVNAAQTGQTIKVKPGTYKETLTINKDIILVGEGSDKTIIDGNNNGSCITINKNCNVTMDGFTLINGHPWFYGGGVDNRGYLTLKNCDLHSNYAKYGGGIYSTGTIILTSCKIQNNAAEHGGGIYNLGALYNDEKSIIKDNKPNNIEVMSLSPSKIVRFNNLINTSNGLLLITSP